jgi:hypothetical protein
VLRVPQGGYLGFNQTNEEMIRFNKKDFLDFLKTRLRGVTIGIYWFEKPTRPEVYEGGRGRIKQEDVPDFCDKCGARIPEDSDTCEGLTAFFIRKRRSLKIVARMAMTVLHKEPRR